MFATAVLGLGRANLLGVRSLTIRDRRYRQSIERTEVLRRAYLFVARNTTLPDMIRTRAQQSLHRLPVRTTPTHFHNCCTKTGKARGIIREFKISRYQMKLDATRGILPGVKLAVW